MEKKTEKSWIKKNWKKVAVVAGVVGTGVAVYILGKKTSIDIPSNFVVGTFEDAEKSMFDSYIDANFSKDDLLEDPAALMIIGEEVVRYNDISIEKANDILQTYAAEMY